MPNDICRICGKISCGQPFSSWVKDTFTNYDLLHPGEIICDDCLFWFDQHSANLQTIMGKDKPQKMQNYSHFVVSGQWLPVSKGDKPQIARLLLSQPFPELAAIAVSGQKHIAFRARRNPPSQSSGSWGAANWRYSSAAGPTCSTAFAQPTPKPARIHNPENSLQIPLFCLLTITQR